MCGISGILNLDLQPLHQLNEKLECQSKLISHRGPDDKGVWLRSNNCVGFSHRRLSIIDLSFAGKQPMEAINKTVITYNGEIYNYKELQNSLKTHWNFNSNSDTECILACYDKFSLDCLKHLRGMFSFAIWDERKKRLFCARDRFGIKPFYYTVVNNIFYFASEVKALLPFIEDISTDEEALSDYLNFQYLTDDKTLFKGIKKLLPGHFLIVENKNIRIQKYWDMSFNIDYSKSQKYFINQTRDLINESLSLHLRSDVPVGSYVSGGIDSSLMQVLSSNTQTEKTMGFHGRFIDHPGYDESKYAKIASNASNGDLKIIDIHSNDFVNNIEKIIYYMDYPEAGPGSFPQFMVSKLASENRKVVFGGQGGDEIFGGYARYVIAYFEQCIKAAIDGTYKNGNYVVTIESIIPNLGILKEYKPLIKQFWKDGLFDDMEKRYFNLINKSSDLKNEINWNYFDLDKTFEKYLKVFNNHDSSEHVSYFDKMTNFDFKCLLPALLHVEDRMSMAHGLESRVPLIDEKIVEFSTSVPADIKFKNGNMKYLIKNSFSDKLPNEILYRRDKMGFPVPLKEWFSGELQTFIEEKYISMIEKNRWFINTKKIKNELGKETKFSRKIWALLNLEIWQQQFHDRAAYFKNLI